MAGLVSPAVGASAGLAGVFPIVLCHALFQDATHFATSFVIVNVDISEALAVLKRDSFFGVSSRLALDESHFAVQGGAVVCFHSRFRFIFTYTDEVGDSFVQMR